MSRANFQPNPNLNNIIREDFEGVAFRGAAVAELMLSGYLGSDNHSRSGVWLDFLPRQSSRRGSGEYPQEQSGNLISSLNVEPEGELQYAVGFFYDNSNKMVYDSDGQGGSQLVPIDRDGFDYVINNLEFGRPNGDFGPLYMTFEGWNADDVKSAMMRSDVLLGELPF
jgi:hypothetical protein